MIFLNRSKIVMLGVATALLIHLGSTNSTLLEQAGKHILDNFFNFHSPTLAQTQSQPKTKLRYVPPQRRPSKNTQASGSRTTTLTAKECSQSDRQPTKLTLLVPQDHDGLTTSGHPTFFWYVSSPVPVEFTLTEPRVPQPLFEQQIQPQVAGFNQLKIPTDIPKLIPGREYRWSVTLICNPDRPSANPFVQSWIQRVPSPPNLTQQIAAATSERDRASIYAKAGLWYDALESLSIAQSANPSDKSIIEDRLSLLEQVGQSELAAQERQRLAEPLVQ